jgi:hypothetical protein
MEGPAVFLSIRSNGSLTKVTALNFVIPSEAEGPAVSFTPKRILIGVTLSPFPSPKV